MKTNNEKSEAKTKSKENLFKKHLDLVLIFSITVISVICAVFNVFVKIDSKLYDAELGMIKEVDSNENIVLVDIDDESLSYVGSWPWSRDILGNALLRMKEFGSREAVFDIEYLSPSVKAVDDNLSEITEQTFNESGQQILDSIYTFGEKVASGEVPSSKAEDYAQNLTDEVGGLLYEMNRNITDGFNKDNDDYFARCVQFFGNAYLTINMRNISTETSEEDVDYAVQRFLFKNVVDKKNLISRDNDYTAKEEGKDINRDFIPAISKIISHARGANFTNIVVDKDGTRRRVELLNEKNGSYTGQLSFGALVRDFEVESMERKGNYLILHNAKIPERFQSKMSKKKKTQDIAIPLDEHGRMLINWLHSDYNDNFRHVPVLYLYKLDQNEEHIVSCIKELLSSSLYQLNIDDRQYVYESEYFVNFYNNITEEKNRLLRKCRGFDIEGNAIKGGLTQEDYDSYFAMRNQYYEELTGFVESFDTIADYEKVDGLVQLKKLVEIYNNDYAVLTEALTDSFCLIGNCATASTDLGVTPFAKRYANLGTHANVVNTIIQQKFIKPVSVFWGLGFIFILALVIILLTKNLSPARKNVFSSIYVVVPIATILILMKVFHVYIPLFVPLVYALVTYFSLMILNFILLEGDKKFLQNTFGAYVAPEVVSQLVKNPEMVKLGGNSEELTALFSDVKTFSGFTEVINNEEGEERGAARLVEILNHYLGALSDAIMENKGTIDKYVGDEIVSFFGAPVPDKDNAFNACVAGIRMLQAEAQYNLENKDTLPKIPETGEPFYLHSRVGLNTGNMVVGNMGSDKKLNYTIMGNNVNLASRLEGTNKAYGSWIMASDSTWQKADRGEHKGLLVARKFDCVRVINVVRPVQIHNILGLRNELPSAQIEAAELFNQGIEWYLKGSDTPEVPKDPEDLKKAYEYFQKAKECYPEDKSSEVFMQRCVMYLKTGIPEVWDGVFTMKSK